MNIAVARLSDIAALADRTTLVMRRIGDDPSAQSAALKAMIEAADVFLGILPVIVYRDDLRTWVESGATAVQSITDRHSPTPPL